MRPINLIPAEERRGERAPLRSGPIAYVVVGALVLAFIGVYAVVSTSNKISDRKSEIAVLEEQLESSTARAQALQSFTDFAGLEAARTETISTLARSRFDWERVMRELALVAPDDITLTTLSGSIGAGSGSSEGGSESAAGITGPSLSINGCGPGHDSVARFVAALRDIDGVTRVGLSSSANQGAASGTEGSSTSSSTAAGGGGCVAPGSMTFEVTVAFDGVAVDPESGGIVPAPEVPADDGSGLTEAQAEGDAARESAESAGEKGRQAVKTYVPGT